MEVREIHNVHVRSIGTAGEFEFTFLQFTDSRGFRHLLHEPVKHITSGKMPLVMVIEELAKVGERQFDAEADRFAVLPRGTGTDGYSGA